MTAIARLKNARRLHLSQIERIEDGLCILPRGREWIAYWRVGVSFEEEEEVSS